MLRSLAFIAQEFGAMDLGDERLNKRSRKILSDLYCSPGDSLLAASRTWPRAKGGYRYMGNKKVTPEKPLDAHRVKLLERCRSEKKIYCIADTSEFVVGDRPATTGVGPLNDQAHRLGFQFHPVFVVTPDRLPLGIADVQFITRDDESLGKRNGPERYQVPIEDRESKVWDRSTDVIANLARTLGPDGPRCVGLYDRGGDIHRVLAKAVANRELHDSIIRSYQPRRLEDDDADLLVWEHVAAQPVAGHMWVDLPATRDRKARRAKLAVRYKEVTLAPPRVRAPDAEKSSPVTINAIHVTEVNPPKTADPIDWKLYTTLPVTNFTEAVACIEAYACRWTIEWLFRTVKTDCCTEDRLLRTGKKLQVALVHDLLVAFLLLYLSRIHRTRPNERCTTVFRDSEWRGLWTYLYEDDLPERPPKMLEMIEMLGEIGGYLARAGDKPPGPRVIMRALRKLPVIERMYLIAQAR